MRGGSSHQHWAEHRGLRWLCLLINGPTVHAVVAKAGAMGLRQSLDSMGAGPAMSKV